MNWKSLFPFRFLLLPLGIAQRQRNQPCGLRRKDRTGTSHDATKTPIPGFVTTMMLLPVRVYTRPELASDNKAGRASEVFDHLQRISLARPGFSPDVDAGRRNDERRSNALHREPIALGLGFSGRMKVSYPLCVFDRTRCLLACRMSLRRRNKFEFMVKSTVREKRKKV